MAGNVLQSIGLTPDWFKSVMGGVISDPSQPDAEAPAAGPPANLLEETQAPQAAAPASDPTNMLQSLNQGAPADAVPPQAPTAPAAAPRTRRSLLDTVGRISDVLAQVGGANALYQPTLDARQDREIALGDHARTVDMDKLKLATAQGTLDDAGRARLTQAVRGTQALLAANPQADISKVFPLLAARAGVDPAQAQALGGELAQNPGLLDGLAGFDDSGDKYGGSVIYATGPDGKITAFQPNLKGGKGRAVLPEGFTAIDPTKAVNLGGSTALVGRSGNVTRILPNSVRPDTVANNQTARDIAAGKNTTALTIAGMPARGKAGTGKSDDAAAQGNSEALIALDNLDRGFQDLHRLNALPGDKAGGAVGNVLSALGRTGAGQYIGEQAGSEAAQKRVAMGKTINTLQQTLIKALPASATRTKFEQEILARSLPDPTRMSFSTAQDVINDYRAIFKRAQAAAVKEASARAPAAPAAKVQPRSGGGAPRPGRPTVSNW